MFSMGNFKEQLKLDKKKKKEIKQAKKQNKNSTK